MGLHLRKPCPWTRSPFPCTHTKAWGFGFSQAWPAVSWATPVPPFPLFSSSQLPEGKEGHRLITATEDFFHGNRCLLQSMGCLCVELSPLSRDCHCCYYLHNRFSSRLPARSCSRNSVLQPCPLPSAFKRHLRDLCFLVTSAPSLGSSGDASCSAWHGAAQLAPQEPLWGPGGSNDALG